MDKSEYPGASAQHQSVCTIGLILHLEGWAVLGSGFTPVVEPSGGDIGVSQPFLDLGDISFMIKGIGGGGGSQGMDADPAMMSGQRGKRSGVCASLSGSLPLLSLFPYSNPLH